MNAPSRYETVVELVEDTFKKYPDRPAYSCMGHSLTFFEVDQLSARFASYLSHDLGLEPGDRIAIQLPNTLQLPVVMYAAIRAGLVLVMANPLYTPREIKHQLCDSEAKALVVLANVAYNAAEIIEQTSVDHVIVTEIADLHPTPKRLLINFIVKNIKKMVPKYRFKNALPLRECFAGIQHLPPKPFKKTRESLFALQYTGGTTGVSKGAMLSHGNLASNVWQVYSMTPEAFIEENGIFIACLPMYHIYALQIHALTSFCAGALNVLIPNPRDLNSLVDAIKQIKFTAFVGINTLYVALCRFPRVKEIDFSHLKVSSAGGMALTEDASNAWYKLTGIPICEGYGLSETSPVVTGNTPLSNELGTIGKPLMDTHIMLIDELGEQVAAGEVGELCVRGPQVMSGYWRRDEENAEVFLPSGHFKTGDMAVLNGNGTYSLVDRKKDMILVSGFNVYPNEVEGVLSMHEDVVEAAVVGVHDEKTGEAVIAYVVPENDDVSVETLKAYCKKNLTGYKRPKTIEFRESLPKSNVGKILRRELRAG